MHILIVEDTLLVREVLRSVCLSLHASTSVTEVGSVAEGLAALQLQRPDVLLLDIGLPDGDGFTVAEAAARLAPPPRVLVVSSHLQEYVVAQCERFHVRGFVHKGTALLATLHQALAAMDQDRTFFSAPFDTARHAWLAAPRTIEKRLSTTQQQVLALIARGFSDDEIAASRGITRKTAEHHRTDILRRLDAFGTPKLIVEAISRGYGKLE